MKDKKTNNKIILAIVALLLIVLIVVGILILRKLDNNDATITSDITDNNNNSNKKGKNKTTTLSFKQMDYTDGSLSEEQKEIAKFFDEDFFHPYSYEELVRYADMLKNINISCYCEVNSILSSDSNTFEAVVQWASDSEEFMGGYAYGDTFPLTEPIIVKGNKPEKMVIKGDVLNLRGKLVGAETRNINGENMYLPIIEIIEIGEGSWYSEDTIRQVSKLVFGNNIKVRRPTDDETEKMVGDYFYTYQDYIWLVEMENQSNLNFKVFDIWQSSPSGLITYNPLFNDGVESDYLNKRLYVTPDLQKYIVFNMSRKDNYVYIDIYDRNLNKLWAKEISKASQIVWDATNTNLIFVSDNDLYNINMETGETVFETYVGKKSDIRIVDNGYILLNQDSDDTVMFVDKEGKIKNKFDVSFDGKEEDIVDMSIQKLDNNYVILYSMQSISGYHSDWTSKYIIIDENGNKVKES